MKTILKETLILMAFLIGTTASAQNLINKSKVSAHLQEMVVNTATKDSHKSVSALTTLSVACDVPAFFERHGCRLIDNVGRIYIVSIPLNKVAALSNNDTIERIEAERMPSPQMDVTPQQVNATGLYAGTNLPQAYTGAGVVAGVFDSYFDFTHPAFHDANGDLRISYYYDFQWPNADGTMGHALENASEIAAQQHSLYTRNGIHGTHVAGIMAGSAVNGQYQGKNDFL